MVGPWVTFVKPRRREVSDIEYLAAIEFGVIASASLTSSSVIIASTGVKAIITPAAGKFAYITKAYIVSHEDDSFDANDLTAQLRISASAIETVSNNILGTGGTGSWPSHANQLFFGSIGESLNGDGAADIDINISIQNDITGWSFIQCLIIDDADSPRLP